MEGRKPGTLIISQNNGRKIFELVSSEWSKPRRIESKEITKHPVFDRINNAEFQVTYDFDRNIWYYFSLPDQVIIGEEKSENNNEAISENQDSPTSREQLNRYYTATAPYNFVPYTGHVVSPDRRDIDFSRYDSTKLTGYIEVNIENKTPLYIRRTMTQSELITLADIENSGDDVLRRKREFLWTISKHYAPGNGLFKIPGSSIRGMLRSMVNMISYGKLSQIDDKYLYFRAFKDSSLEYNDLYSHIMTSGNAVKGYSVESLGGYLFKEGKDYFIQPATEVCRIEESDVISSGIITDKMAVWDTDRGKYKENSKYSSLIKSRKVIPIYYKSMSMDPDTDESHSVNLWHKKVQDIQLKTKTTTTPSGYSEGFLILTGWVGNQRRGKQMHWVIGAEDTSETRINATNAVTKYGNDITRKEGIDLREGIAHNRIPCFYCLDDNNIISIGHTGLMRIPYNKKISDSIHTNDSNYYDFPEFMFGTIDADGKSSKLPSLPGRVFVEDAVIDKDTDQGCFEPSHPKILSSPKPTSFQLYLKQPGPISINGTKLVGLKNYNSDNAQIRGYKMYWHRPKVQWEESHVNVDDKPKLYTSIQPLNPGCQFSGKIRFENLSDVELGSLLFALNLPVGCCHKLGMAKPYGLGSVKIIPALYLSKPFERYGTFLSEFNGIGQEPDVQQYVMAFCDFMKAKLNLQTNDLWNATDRYLSLKRMLDYENAPSNSETDYMPLKRFRERGREILKKPIEFE